MLERVWLLVAITIVLIVALYVIGSLMLDWLAASRQAIP